ncbi:MAG: class F sortase [Chloroflexi bacterium]|nr:MAG: class F sortase [Chloroflexota bacterium]
MQSGLNIKTKRDISMLRWVSAAIIVLIILTIGWFGYRWYVSGEQPPIVPVPVSAMADATIDESPVTQSQVAEYKVPASQPRYISIPDLGIYNSRVKAVGLTTTKNLDTPKNLSDTAWYEKSALPGTGAGAVVINGHNGGITRNGVFVNLNMLKQGSAIIVERGDGKKFTYSVVENKTVSLLVNILTIVPTLLQWIYR